MNNDINIVIKSQDQPDGGEGHSRRQTRHGNMSGGEGPRANMRGDEQKPSEAIWNRDESATQDEVLYSSYDEGRRIGARARKVNEHTPGDPLSVTLVTGYLARDSDRLSEVSREHSSRRSHGTGVVADGLPVQRSSEVCRQNRSVCWAGPSEKHHPDEGSNGAAAEWQR